jgi:hypothetical protein
MFNKYITHTNVGPSRIDATHTEKKASVDKSNKIYKEVLSTVGKEVINTLRLDLPHNVIEANSQVRHSDIPSFSGCIYSPRSMGYVFSLFFILNGKEREYQNIINDLNYSSLEYKLRENKISRDEFIGTIFNQSEKMKKELIDEFIDICEDEILITEATDV